jgi:acyl carrier protein
LTAGDDLDYFVLYSSLAAVSSQPGQGSYAAANAYMDGLATMRRAGGLAGISIQWGPWKDAGMIREAGAQRSLLAWADQGIRAMSIGMSLDGVHRLLAQPTPVTFIARVDWKQFGQYFGSKLPTVFSLLVESAVEDSSQECDVRRQLAELAPQERAARLESHLKTIVAAVLRSKTSRIDAGSRFGSMGVDSLMSVEIAKRLTERLDLRVPVTVVFNFPSVEVLTQELMRRMDLQAGVAAPQLSIEMEPPTTVITPSLSAIAQMSEDEALQSILNVGEAQ